MVVDADEQHTFCAGVDEAHEMLLARLQLEHGKTGVVNAGTISGRVDVVLDGGVAVEVGFAIDELVGEGLASCGRWR